EERLDQEAIHRYRTEREARMKQLSDAVIQAAYDTHDALTLAQRRAVVDWAQAQSGPGRFGAEILRRLVSARVDQALEFVRATPQQSASARAIRDRVFAGLDEAHRAHRAELERALALFTPERIDAAQVEALRADHQARE